MATEDDQEQLRQAERKHSRFAGNVAGAGLWLVVIATLAAARASLVVVIAVALIGIVLWAYAMLRV